MSEDSEREDFVKDLEKSLNDICLKAKISDKDKNIALSSINEIRNVSLEDEFLMQETISQAYGYLNLVSNKAMYQNVKELNDKMSTQPVSPKVKEKMRELEKTLLLVIEGMENRDFEIYQNNVQKIVELGAELEKLGQIK